MFKILFCVFAVAVTLVASAGCGAVCAVTSECPDTCSVCAPKSTSSSTKYCQPACNETCHQTGYRQCLGAYNGGCGNCVNSKCTTGKICGVACMQDSECGTFGFPYCTRCVSGKCSGACGTKCTGDGLCNANSTCPRCVSGFCRAPGGCGAPCMVDQDCPAQNPKEPKNCWACVNQVCTLPPAVVAQP